MKLVNDKKNIKRVIIKAEPFCYVFLLYILTMKIQFTSNICTCSSRVSSQTMQENMNALQRINLGQYQQRAMS